MEQSELHGCRDGGGADAVLETQRSTNVSSLSTFTNGANASGVKSYCRHQISFHFSSSSEKEQKKTVSSKHERAHHLAPHKGHFQGDSPLQAAVLRQPGHGNLAFPAVMGHVAVVSVVEFVDLFQIVAAYFGVLVVDRVDKGEEDGNSDDHHRHKACDDRKVVLCNGKNDKKVNESQDKSVDYVCYFMLYKKKESMI